MSLAVKIFVQKTGATKTMQFDGGQSVGEVIREIRNKIGEGGSDHGLFLVGDDIRSGKWLENNKTLNFYDVRSGDTMEFKKKHRPLRVRMMDGTQKTLMIDDSMPVSDLTAVIASHIGLSNPEEFSLKTVESADTEWLNPSQTLREQGLEDMDPVLLKQRFHYTDHNIDTSNPQQLNLLFQQNKQSIIGGQYPCTEQEAVQFAAMLCQIQFGDNNPSKHKPGFLDLAAYLPAEYVKTKKIEQAIWAEHRGLAGLNELNGKYRFVQLCRSLKTYGVTFYKVKEQHVDAKGKKKKGKLVDRLLGITREKIVRLDNDTKEVLSSYNLTHLRRWAASANSFTFDFGDYEEAYYSVQTKEGEQIAQVISGYIDIILKKQKDAARQVEEEQEEQVVEEEDIAAQQGVAVSSSAGTMQHPAMANVAGVGMMQGGGMVGGMGGMHAGMHGGVMQATNSGAATKWKGDFSRGNAGELQSFTPGNAMVLNAAGLGGLLGDLEGAFAAVNAACNELNLPLTRNQMGDDPASVQWRNQALQGTRTHLRTHANGMTVATAQVISSTVCTDADMFNPELLAAACQALGNHVTQLATLGRSAASLLNDEDSEEMLEACKQLGVASKRLVGAANGAAGGLSQGVVDPKLREELLNSAQMIGAQITTLLAKAGAGEVDAAGQNRLFDATSKVAQATTKLVGEAKSTAGHVEGAENQQAITSAAKGVWTATSQLVAVVKVVAPTANHAKSLEQLVLTSKIVKGACGKLLQDSESAGADEEDMGKLKDAVSAVDAALAELIENAKQAGEKPDYTKEFERAANAITEATTKLVDSTGNPQAIITNVKAAGQGSAVMIKIAKFEANAETDLMF